MSSRRIRNLLLLLLVGAVAYWIYRDRPTLSEVVDRITGPIFGSHAAVKESERKRIDSEVQPAVGGNEEVSVSPIRENMTTYQVRDVLGAPDQVEEVQVGGKKRVRWTYRRAGRVIDFEDGRSVSIAVR